MKRKTPERTRIYPQHPGQPIARDLSEAGRYNPADGWYGSGNTTHLVQFTALAGFNDGARWHISHNPAIPLHTLCGMPRKGQGSTTQRVAKYKYGSLDVVTCGDCARVVNFCHLLLAGAWPQKFGSEKVC